MKTIGHIKLEYQSLSNEQDYQRFINQYFGDQRKGVIGLINKAHHAKQSLVDERIRLEKMSKFENQWDHKALICGIDEVGRGPLAGPVVAAAVILPRNLFLFGLNDSKKLSARQREALYEKILQSAIDIGVGIVDSTVIDEINILEATKKAMSEAVSHLQNKPDALLIDALNLPISIPQKNIIKGDQKSISIAAASIVAKVVRDQMMKDFDLQYPGYDFVSNMGYGTPKHYEGINKLGLCPIHRRSFIH